MSEFHRRLDIAKERISEFEAKWKEIKLKHREKKIVKKWLSVICDIMSVNIHAVMQLESQKERE